jgi:hypothetical protein
MDNIEWNFWLCQLSKLDRGVDTTANRELPNKIVSSFFIHWKEAHVSCRGDALALDFILIWFVGDVLSFLGSFSSKVD